MTMEPSPFRAGPPESLDEARIAAEQALVRGQLVQRLERLNGRCEDRMNEQDPTTEVRWAELSLRISDRLATYYRLDAKQVAPEDPAGEGVQEAVRVNARAVVSAQLDDLAARSASPSGT